MRIAVERRAVHQCERLRRRIGEFSNGRSGGGSEASGPKELLGLPRGADDVLRGERRSVAGMCEEIAAHQRVGGLFEQDPRLPTVRYMRSIDVTDPLSSQLDDLAV